MSVFSLLAKPHPSIAEDLFVHPDRYGEKTFTEAHLLTSTGEVKEAEICMVLAKTPQGAEKGYAYLRDMTESKKMERKVREVTQQFEKIAEMGDDGIVVFDQAFKIVFANQMASEIIGIPKEDLIG